MNIVAESTSSGRFQRPVSRPAAGEVCEVLSGILADGVDIHRCLAAKALGRIGAPAAVEPLIGALLDEDEDVRTDAAEALAALADPKSADQLFENLLGDPCTEVKLAAIDALTRMRDRRIVPWLRRMVRGRDEEIIWDEEEFYSSGWDDWVDIQIRAVSALAELKAAEAVPDIVAAVRDENAQDLTEAAFKALACLGKPGVGALAAFLDEEPVRVRRRAAAALAGATAEEAAEPLARAFADPSAEVRAAALRARAALFPDDIRLAALLEDRDAAIRAEAALLVGSNHPDRLIAMLDDPSARVQAAALDVLADIGGGPGGEALTAALRSKIESPNAEVSKAAAGALAATAPAAALDELVPLFGDTGRPVSLRLGAILALAGIGGEPVTEALVGLIDDTERPIRLAAMSELARLARKHAEWPNAAGTALLSALRGDFDPADEEPGRESAGVPDTPPGEADVSADESTGDEESGADVFPTSTLTAILEDAPVVRKAAGLPDEGVELTPTDMERLALAKNAIGKKRVPIAPKVVKHEDIRRLAARMIGDIAHEDVALQLAAALSVADAETRMAAADSLARIGALLNPLPEVVADALVAALETAGRDLKLPLIRALAACGREKSGDVLLSQLADNDGFVRAEAVRALFIQGPAGPEIETLLDDPDPSVRLRAAEAVAGTGGAGAVRLLVDFAFSFEGCHARQTAGLLRNLDATAASAAFAKVLRDRERRRVWSVAIEALEELNRSQPAAA